MIFDAIVSGISAGAPAIGDIFSGIMGPSVSEQLTDIVNAVEPQLQQNLEAFRAGQISASAARQRAMTLMDGMTGQLMSQGPAGQNAAAERDRRVDPSRLTWDWLAYYVDPIPGGGTALPGEPGTGGAGETARRVMAGLGGNSGLLILGAIAIVAVLMFRGRS